MSIPQLQNALKQKQTEMDRLHRQRSGLSVQLQALDRQIIRVAGDPRAISQGRSPRRARNNISLVAAIEQVLKAAKKPMSVGAIMDAVIDRGYHSTSSNFRGIVNQTLIKERKKFKQHSRGMYTLARA
jgi:hypothetical protein